MTERRASSELWGGEALEVASTVAIIDPDGDL